MNYSVKFVWVSGREHPTYLPPGFKNTPLNCYRAIHRDQLLKHGVHLPVPDSSGWSCSLRSENEVCIFVNFFSSLEIEAFKKQMNNALVPVFTDRIEVKLSEMHGLGVVLSN
jgi:hypothetical protein